MSSSYRTNWKALEAMDDEEIDYSDIQLLDDNNAINSAAFKIEIL